MAVNTIRMTCPCVFDAGLPTIACADRWRHSTAALSTTRTKGKNMLKKVLVSVIAAGALSVPLAEVAWADPPTDPGSGNANSAKPEDPNGYGEIVRFGAREDHDLYPGPGNVVGGVRSDIASSGPGELSNFVKGRQELGGSRPNPPGHN